jgi:shikimate kinase
MQGVFLVGFMGAGKTSVGQALAQELGWRFVDLDALIEEGQARLIAEIFSTVGEPAFRIIESAALRQVMDEVEAEPAIVALGGGAFLQAPNFALLKHSGATTVFLDAPIEELYARCQPATAERPLCRDLNQFRQLYESRRQGYMAADFRLDTSHKSVPEVAAQVIKLLGLAQARRPAGEAP